MGVVFEGRYKAIPVQNDNYLLAIVRYIHRNPVRAGIVTKASDYKWSSDGCYSQGWAGFVNCSLVLDMLSENRQSALMEYYRFMENDDEKDWESGNYIGNDSFALVVDPIKEKPVRVHLNEILLRTGVSHDELLQIKDGSRKRSLQPFKIAFAHEAFIQGYTMREIGKHINMSHVAISLYIHK